MSYNSFLITKKKKQDTTGIRYSKKAMVVIVPNSFLPDPGPTFKVSDTPQKLQNTRVHKGMGG